MQCSYVCIIKFFKIYILMMRIVAFVVKMVFLFRNESKNYIFPKILHTRDTDSFDNSMIIFFASAVDVQW